jgi:hypothetical protein
VIFLFERYDSGFFELGESVQNTSGE